MTRRRSTDHRQLLLEGLVEIPSQVGPRPGELDIDSAIRAAISASLKRSPKSRFEIAAQMSELVGQEISKFMLDAYSAESRETHKFPLQYLPAFVMATGDASILALLAEKCGCVALARSDMALLERGRIREEIERLEERERELSRTRGGRNG